MFTDTLHFMLRNDNFIDKTFVSLADIVLGSLPTSSEAKKSFFYYRTAMEAQTRGAYLEALQNYYNAICEEEDPIQRSYIWYNIGLILQNNGAYKKAMKYFKAALSINGLLPQAWNNVAVLCHYLGTECGERGHFLLANEWFELAAIFWTRAIKLVPGNYTKAENWLKQQHNTLAKY